MGESIRMHLIKQMTWDQFLSRVDSDDERRRIIDWYNSQPDVIRDLIKQWPPSTMAIIGGEKFHVIGYAERDDDKLYFMVSHIDPCDDYEGAIAAARSFRVEGFER